MTEITLEAAENYLTAHVGALNNQVPNGDPFVFLNAFSLLIQLSKRSGIAMEYLLPSHAAFYADAVIPSTYALVSYFGVDSSVLLTHQNELHGYQAPGTNRYVVAAEPLINDVRMAVLNLFSRAKTDKVLAAKLYASFNEHPFIRG